MIKCNCVVIHDDARLPTFAHESDAGRDFYSSEDCNILPNTTVTIKTGLKLKMEWNFPKRPQNKALTLLKEDSSEEIYDLINSYFLENFDVYLSMRSRSGLASKNGLHVGAGVIDVDYTGEIGIVIANVSKKAYQVKKGDKIAQGIFELRPKVSFTQVEVIEETERGNKGFGSSGN